MTPIQQRKNQRFRQSPFYGVVALGLFSLEAAIACFIAGGFIRHTLGDALAAALIYAALLCVTRMKRRSAAASAFAFAVMIEGAQGANLIDHLGLAGSTLAQLVLGSTFSWADIAAYGAGALGAWAADVLLRRPSAAINSA